MGLAHPEVLWTLLLVPLLVVGYAIDGQIRRALLERLGHQPQVRRMTASLSVARRRWKGILTVACVAALAVALAQPFTTGAAHRAPRRGLGIVVALDFSKSMLAPDVYPSRLDRARRELDQLLDRLRGDRVGLVAFSGVTLSYPLANDYRAAKLFWRDLSPSDFPVGGTNLAAALRDSLELLDRAARSLRADHRKVPAQVIILLTDGGDTEGGSLEVAREAAKRGVKIFTIGIGTSAGEFVAEKKRDDGSVEYLEENGKPVRMRLDADTLRQIAAISGGDYFQADGKSFGVDRVQRAIASLERTEDEQRLVSDPDDESSWPLVAALGLLVAGALLRERRRAAAPAAAPSEIAPAVRTRPPARGVAQAAILLALLLPGLTGFDLFERTMPEVDEGNRALAAGHADEALAAYDRALKQRPDDPAIHYDRGAALLALKRLPEAREELGRAAESADAGLRADALYNLGNAWLAEDRAKEALDSYKRALLLRPDDRRAKWNLELALRRLRPPPPKPQGSDGKSPPPPSNDKRGDNQPQQAQGDPQQQQQQQQQPPIDAQKLAAALERSEEQRRAEEEKRAAEEQQKQAGMPKPARPEPKGEGEAKQGGDAREGNTRDQAKEPTRDMDRQQVEAVLESFERVEPTVQKDLARRKAAGVRRPRRDW